MNGDRPSILVTGASSGIGLACARWMAGRGWRVLAGVRAMPETEEPEITRIPLDVTDAESIAGAAERARAELGAGGLAALVNNAGIGVGGPLECVPIEEIRRQFEVNVLGLAAVTQAFLPLLRAHAAPGAQAKAPTTIVNISSVSGRVVLPYLAPYAASKHAVEAISEALRHELAGWGIRVVLIEPGPIATPIWKKANELTTSQAACWPAEKRALYPSYFGALAGKLAEAQASAVGVDVVSAAIERAVTSRRPRARYLIGPGTLLARVRRFLPDQFWDWLVRRELRRMEKANTVE